MIKGMRFLRLREGAREFRDWILRLFRQPIFVFVTLWGHLAILGGALAFYVLERSVVEFPHGFFSAYYWAISTAVTVGSADVQPVTIGGKLTAIFLMVAGSLFLWTYTALFAASLVSPVVRRVRREVAEVEGEMAGLEREEKIDRKLLEKLVTELARLNDQKEKS